MAFKEPEKRSLRVENSWTWTLLNPQRDRESFGPYSTGTRALTLVAWLKRVLRFQTLL